MPGDPIIIVPVAYQVQYAVYDGSEFQVCQDQNDQSYWPMVDCQNGDTLPGLNASYHGGATMTTVGHHAPIVPVKAETNYASVGFIGVALIASRIARALRG